MLKRSPLDALFSELVRERANWICESCAIELRHEPKRMHCAHIYSRRHVRIRHDPINAFCLCAKCHFEYTDKPLEFATFTVQKIGQAMADQLSILARTVHKRPKGWEKEAKAHYRQELERMKLLRANGNTGYIEFAGYF